MGGLITVLSSMAEPDLFKSIVVMGPLIKMDPNIATPLKKTLASVFSGILPSFSSKYSSIFASAIQISTKFSAAMSGALLPSY